MGAEALEALAPGTPVGLAPAAALPLAPAAPLVPVSAAPLAMASSLSRHTLVWLDDDGWHHAQAAALPAHREALARWAQHDWPLVVRRADVATGQPAGADHAATPPVALGLPLPPYAATGHKLRIAVSVPPHCVSKIAAPVTLAAAAATHAPWRAAIDALMQAAGAPGCADLRVFGSLAMQTLTSLPYVTPASDIDLLYQPATRTELAAMSALLAEYSVNLPLDGEIVFPGGQAVAWKEWVLAQARGAARVRVLVKQLQRVYLADPQQLLARLAP